VRGVGEFLSYAEQAAHYFERPHQAPAAQPLRTPAAWRGRDVARREQWCVRLGESQLEEIDAALAVARKCGKPTGEMTAEDFPLGSLVAEIGSWRKELAEGRGFQVVSGLPVERWSPEEAELFFWCLGLHLGRPGAQNPRGDLLGHVTDTGADGADAYVRLYQTASNIAYHCDAADAVGLLCLRSAKSGGASRIVSSVSVYNELLARRPDLAPRLYEPFLLDVRNEDSSGALRYLPIAPCRFDGGTLRTFYHSDYFRSVLRHDDVPRFTSEEQELLDTYEEIACDPEFYLDMELEPGDIQWLSNHSILHARTAYEDHEAPDRRRHLLRLWLSL